MNSIIGLYGWYSLPLIGWSLNLLCNIYNVPVRWLLTPDLLVKESFNQDLLDSRSRAFHIKLWLLIKTSRGGVNLQRNTGPCLPTPGRSALNWTLRSELKPRTWQISNTNISNNIILIRDFNNIYWATSDDGSFESPNIYGEFLNWPPYHLSSSVRYWLLR